MSKLIKEMLDALNAVNQNKTQPYDRQGEVKRIEGKIAWVKLEGSDRETPIQMTIACDVGDTVQARIGGGSAWLTGNLTAPPTDDKKANEAITMVTNVVQEVQEQVEEALEDATDVEDVTMQYCLSDSSSTFVQYGDWSDTPPEYVSGKYYWVRSVLVDDEGNETYGEPRYSQETQLSVETSRAYATTNAHFWYASTGAYVTDSTQTAYMADASGKYATRVTPTGILQSYGGTTLSSWTNSGISFYQGGNTVASFGSGGMSVYADGVAAASFSKWSTTGAGKLTIYGTSDSGNSVVVGPISLNFYGNTDDENGMLISNRLRFGGGTDYVDIQKSGSGQLSMTAPNGVYSTGAYYAGGYKLLTKGTVAASFNVTAGSYSSDTVSASKTGYKAVGIIGWSYTGTSSTYCNMYVCYIDDSDAIHYGFRNLNSSTNATLSITFYVLYISSRQGV